MNPLDIIITALRSIGGSKLRSSLTLLGIIIGITAVTVLMSIGRGVQQNITAQIQAQGTNLLFVQSDFGGTEHLTLEDAEALVDPLYAPSVKAVAPQINTNGTIAAGREDTNAQVIGATPDYAVVRNVSIGDGQFINPAHVRNNLDVAVLSASVSDALFGTNYSTDDFFDDDDFGDEDGGTSARGSVSNPNAESPVNKRIRINGRQFTVVGVLEDTGATFFGFGDQVFIPITTAHYRLSRERTTQGEMVVNSIDAQAVSQEAIDDAKLEIASILRLRHRVTGENHFEIDTLQELIDTVNQVTTVLVLFLGTVAGISLLVGGIGVMNIMLVSVTERTREIGVRKAMGAKRRDILMQFIAEAVFLTTTGGVIGLLISFTMSPLTNWIVSNVGNRGGAEITGLVFHADVALLALSVSAIVGLLSGIYPAMRAAPNAPNRRATL